MVCWIANDTHLFRQIAFQLTELFQIEIDAVIYTDQFTCYIGTWRLIIKYFLRSFSPFRWFKKDSCQFLAEECAQYWLTA